MYITVHVVATKAIGVGEELFANYKFKDDNDSFAAEGDRGQEFGRGGEGGGVNEKSRAPRRRQGQGQSKGRGGE